MLISLEGEEATGKTTLAYTAPLPIVGFSFDLGTDRAFDGTQHDKWFAGLKIERIRWKRGVEIKSYDWSKNDITVFELPRPVQLSNDKFVGMADLWAYFIFHCAEALEDENIKSIVIDTMTLARRVKADAYLEELQGKEGSTRKQLVQVEWGHPNDSIRSIYNAGKIGDKHLIVIHHLTDDRIDVVTGTGKVEKGVLTGKRILEGYKPYRHVDIALRLAFKEGNVVATWLKSGFNQALCDSTMKNPSWDNLVSSMEMGLGGRIKFDRRNSA